MTTKIASLKCNKFGGIRRINASFSNEFISSSDMQNVELFNTGINSGVGIRTTKGNLSICENIPNDERIINLFESVQNNFTYYILLAISMLILCVGVWLIKTTKTFISLMN